MPVSSRNGWGVQTQFFPVTSSVAGPINAVLRNVGVAANIVAGPQGSRLTKISYRVDLAPDVAVGTVNVPSKWRLLVLAGDLPNDVGLYQEQAYPTGAHPEIPRVTASGTAVPTLHDEWLDFAAGDAGLNRIANVSWADSGPTVGGTEKMSILLIPIIDANLSQTLLGVANAQVYLGCYGLGVSVGESYQLTGGPSRSLPRYDVSLDGA